MEYLALTKLMRNNVIKTYKANHIDGCDCIEITFNDGKKIEITGATVHVKEKKESRLYCVEVLIDGMYVLADSKEAAKIIAADKLKEHFDGCIANGSITFGASKCSAKDKGRVEWGWEHGWPYRAKDDTLDKGKTVEEFVNEIDDDPLQGSCQK
jgi:hypothetical protein